MARLTWLADELRKAGLKVVEVDGWRTRGSTEFDPIGVTWHATAGSRTSTAKAEVHVILTGSTTAPAPIAQIMADRDGTLYVCAAGRCNHNKVGWDGPNKGLGNTRLLGIEMANDNKGEPWPDAQLDAVRRGTAVIMRRLGADPMRRLAAHYEHQPYATRPPGEGSTKSDPFGVVMTKERPLVAAMMNGDEMSEQTVLDALGKFFAVKVEGSAATGTQTSRIGKNALDQGVPNVFRGGKTEAWRLLGDTAQAIKKLQAAMGIENAEVVPTAEENAAAVLAGLRGAGPEDTAAALRAVLGNQAVAVGRILAAA